MRFYPLHFKALSLVIGGALALLAAGASAQPAPAASAPPIPAVTPTSPSTIVRYDEKCMAKEVLACLGDAFADAVRTGKKEFRSPPPLGGKYMACSRSSWGGRGWETVDRPRTATDTRPCFAESLLVSEAVGACRSLVQFSPPEACERTELTESGWRATLRAEFAAIAEELKRACRAAGKSDAECAHPATALPLAPVAPAAPEPAGKR